MVIHVIDIIERDKEREEILLAIPFAEMKLFHNWKPLIDCIIVYSDQEKKSFLFIMALPLKDFLMLKNS